MPRPTTPNTGGAGGARAVVAIGGSARLPVMAVTSPGLDPGSRVPPSLYVPQPVIGGGGGLRRYGYTPPSPVTVAPTPTPTPTVYPVPIDDTIPDQTGGSFDTGTGGLPASIAPTAQVVADDLKKIPPLYLGLGLLALVLLLRR